MRRTGVLALFVLLAVPRIVRLAYPQVWIEDESYLNGAFMLARGFAPYRDFPLPHLPALEAMLAAVFLATPISIRTAEVVTQIAAFLGSVLVFFVGRKLADDLTGALAAIVFATSALLFRYHVFEREVFLVVPVLAAIRIALAGASNVSRQRDRERDAVWMGVLMAAAMSIKLTAVASLVGLAAYLYVDGRGRSSALTAAIAFGIIGAASVCLALVFRTDFLVQIFLFRLVHAPFPSLIVKLDEMRYTMDFSLALGVPGVALLAWTGRMRRWAAPLIQLISGIVFLVILNPTFWAHTGIEILPWLALPAGYLAAAALRRQRGAAVSVAAAIALLVFVAPIRNLNWEGGDGSVYGFGYRSRADIAKAADAVRQHSAADARVATPAIVAFAANRREVIPYAEIAGEIAELTAIVNERGYMAALTDDRFRGRTMWDSVEASRDYMAPALAAAIREGRAAAVINDVTEDLMPVQFVNVARETLAGAGYQLGAIAGPYEVWWTLAGR